MSLYICKLVLFSFRSCGEKIDYIFITYNYETFFCTLNVDQKEAFYNLLTTISFGAETSCVFIVTK